MFIIDQNKLRTYILLCDYFGASGKSTILEFFKVMGDMIGTLNGKKFVICFTNKKKQNKNVEKNKFHTEVILQNQAQVTNQMCSY